VDVVSGFVDLRGVQYIGSDSPSTSLGPSTSISIAKDTKEISAESLKCIPKLPITTFSTVVLIS
jgi:hypothetical protein